MFSLLALLMLGKIGHALEHGPWLGPGFGTGILQSCEFFPVAVLLVYYFCPSTGYAFALFDVVLVGFFYLCVLSGSRG